MTLDDKSIPFSASDYNTISSASLLKIKAFQIEYHYQYPVPS